MKRTGNPHGLGIPKKYRAALPAFALACLLATATASAAHADPADGGCGGPHWVGSWLMSPSDAMPVSDMALTPTRSLFDQTYRIVVVPHLGGQTLRLHLTNRHNPLPVTFGAVTLAEQDQGSSVRPDTLRHVTFGGQASVTAAPDADLVSDPIDLDFDAFTPLSVSVFVPGLSVLAAENIVGLSTSYYGPPGSGDQTTDPAGAALTMNTTSVLFAFGVDVLAPAQYSSVVTVGDSISTGYEGATYYEGPQDPAIVDRNLRYTDFLQRRLNAAGIPLSVLNSSTWGNRVVLDETIPQTGPGALARLQRDVIDTAGISDVILAMGTNDLAFPPTQTPEQLAAAYTDIANRLHAAGIRLHLATIPPSVRSFIAGGISPNSDPVRQQVNAWIRTQHVADDVIDFDAVLRDPADPAAQRPDLVSPTLVHPNPRGHQAMADSVDLGAFQGSRCR
ncbi:GDSL-type esterase/lipase family protein [Nocardia sp. BMG111209]|uniref:GDSL-type esterase/lipase family protein n=1 Tax=Nocardia sp. BMG111209 TaxID=1160137 RepID=UPI000360CF68|nr:GDSL-type esterase/lipase family protein [Nocardia sp. BMG111209]